MYHKKKEMGMGGRMEMGHGGDMGKAVKIYLMKKGGKTAFPDLTGDGKVTFADILKGRLKKGKKKSMQGGGRTMTESEYLEILRRLDPKGEYRPDRLELAMAKTIRQPVTGRDASNDPVDRGEPGQMRMSIDTILEKLEDPSSLLYRSADAEQIDQMIRSRYPSHGNRTKEDEMNLRKDLDEAQLLHDLRDTVASKVRRQRGESYNYGGKVKMLRGGKVEYGIGGAVMGGINALMQGKGLAGAAGAAAKGFVTPGSGIAQGANLVGNLAQKSNNPMLQNIGKMAGMASNFLPGGNPMGALGNLAGMFQARGGMMVPPKMRLLRR